MEQSSTHVHSLQTRNYGHSDIGRSSSSIFAKFSISKQARIGAQSSVAYHTTVSSDASDDETHSRKHLGQHKAGPAKLFHSADRKLRHQLRNCGALVWRELPDMSARPGRHRLDATNSYSVRVQVYRRCRTARSIVPFTLYSKWLAVWRSGSRSMVRVSGGVFFLAGCLRRLALIHKRVQREEHLSPDPRWNRMK
jgi:hypothetical protein